MNDIQSYVSKHFDPIEFLKEHHTRDYMRSIWISGYEDSLSSKIVSFEIVDDSCILTSEHKVTYNLDLMYFKKVINSLLYYQAECERKTDCPGYTLRLEDKKRISHRMFVPSKMMMSFLAKLSVDKIFEEVYAELDLDKNLDFG